MQELTERDMAYDMLYCAKMGAEMYMHALLESATPRSREVFHRLHDDCLRDQWRIWELLHDRAEYRVQEAPRHEIEDVRRRMAALARTHEGAAAFRGADGGRWEAGRGEPSRWEGRGGGTARWNGREDQAEGAARGSTASFGARPAEAWRREEDERRSVSQPSYRY